jgi:hypothetical protein
MVRQAAYERTKKDECRILIEKSEEKRTIGRPMHRWEDNMKKNLK